MEIHGAVKFYIVNDRYGFIVGDNGQEYFVHESQILSPRKKLIKDEKVLFSIGVHKGRTVAINVLPDQLFEGQQQSSIELVRTLLGTVARNSAAENEKGGQR